MTKILFALLLLIAGISFFQMPEVQSGNWADAWKALAPNIVVESVGLLLALLIVEILLRDHRRRSGVTKIAPALMRQLGSVWALEAKLIDELKYTPREFKQVYKDYIDGKFDPIHIPEEFKNRLKAAIAPIQPSLFDEAAEAAAKTSSFSGRFASLLDEEHIMILELNADHWKTFAALAKDSAASSTDLAEAFLDAHDDLGDVAQIFEFEKHAKRIVSD